jgi:poly(A) polymerase
VVAPVILSRQDHPVSRRDVDSDALKVLYRLHEHRYTAYLVGGSVRDLLLGRRPKDFDIGTDAHPYQIKKLFRNCWIIGRRFRLAHVKFGPKTIEVATFRKIVPDSAPDAPGSDASHADAPVVVASSPEPAHGDANQLHRDNTFGTPEEDAFRRDFTINGLFYDIGTYAVIDYVGGLEDLQRRVIRSIGDPRVRFVEDPVRMLRAAVMSARLDFHLDPLVVAAIEEHCDLITTASPARLLEEYYKILRSGYAEATFRALRGLGLLERITPEMKSPPPGVWEALAALDRYRAKFPTAPPELTNTILIGALLEPLGALARPVNASARDADRISFGILPIARRDLERLRQMTELVPRLRDRGALSPRAVRSLPFRPAFTDALTRLEIEGESAETIETWKQAHRQRTPEHPHGHATHPAGTPQNEAGAGKRRRRRRRRRRGRGGPSET